MYNFDSTTTNSDPGPGNFRLGSGTQSSSTVARFDNFDLNNVEADVIIPGWNDSTSTVKGLLWLVKATDATANLVFEVTASTAAAGYTNVTISNVSASTASPFTNGDDVYVSFVRTGDKGDTGATGDADTIPAASPLPAPSTVGLLRMYKDVAFIDNGEYWWPLGGQMEQIQWEWTHFFNNNAQKGELQSAATGGTVDTGTASAGNQGVLSLSTSTSATGRASYAAGQSSALRGTADKLMHFHTRVRFPTLSTSGERYFFQTGYISSLTAASGDGFHFRYDESVSANWYAVVVNNAAGTAGVDTTIAVATNTFQKLRIEIDEPNASAKFYIDGTLRATITTNFPGTTRDFGPGINLRKTNGTTARTCEVDYLGYWSLMTTTV